MESKTKQEDDWSKLNLEEEKSGQNLVLVGQDSGKHSNSSGSPKKKSKYDQQQELVSDQIKERWETEQNQLKQQLIEENRFDWILDSDPSKTTLTRVGAIDISYSKSDGIRAVAALIVLEYPSMKIIYEDYE